MQKKFNAKDDLFVAEYLIDLDPKRAALAAGFSMTTAATKAYQWVSNGKVKPHVFEEIQKRKQLRNQELNIDASYVLGRLIQIDEMDVIDILDSRGSFKPIADWPKIWRQFISGIDVSEIWEGSGDDKKIAGLLKKVKWPDKTKNLELIGKHVNVQAFKDQVAHSGAVELMGSIRETLQKVDGKTWGLPNE